MVAEKPESGPDARRPIRISCGSSTAPKAADRDYNHIIGHRAGRISGRWETIDSLSDSLK